MISKHLLAPLGIALGCICLSCGKGNISYSHDYKGTFITKDSVKFELYDDSSTCITFPNQLTYKSVWKVVKDRDGMEWVNIEFGGNQNHYYLKDGFLYRSERNMRHEFWGAKIMYLD